MNTKKEQIRFSIIIPVYNSELYLNKCLNSVLSQDMNSFEIICINDGSNDNSVQILKSYSSKTTKLKVFNQKNKGVSAARNVGINKSTGKYILFLDSDDYLLSNSALTDLNKIINTSPNVDCIYFPGGSATEDWFETETYKEEYYQNGWDCLKEHCCKTKLLVFGSIYTQCYKRSILIENQIYFDTNLTFGEDRLFVIKFFSYCKDTVVFPNPIYCYFIHPNSLMTSANISKKIESGLLFTIKAFDLIESNKNLQGKEIYKYINGTYINTKIYEYQNQKSKYTKIDSHLLFKTSIGFKRNLQSFFLFLHPNIYLLYKTIAKKIMKK